jgi:hypothetical protein
MPALPPAPDTEPPPAGWSSIGTRLKSR